MYLGQLDAMRVDADVVDIEDVDAVQAEPRIAEFDRTHDAVIAVVIVKLEGQRVNEAQFRHLVLGHRFQQPADLGGQHVAVAWLGAQIVAEATFRQAETVMWRGVVIADAIRPRGVEDRLRVRIRHRLVEIAQRGAAETDFGDIKPGVADTAGLHARAPIRGR